MSLIFEHLFDDTTGFRIVTLPNEKLKRETVWVQVRVSTGPSTVKLVKIELVDPKTGEDVYPALQDALIQDKIKDIGRQCDDCKKYFLPTSPNQKVCVDCKGDTRKLEILEGDS